MIMIVCGRMKEEVGKVDDRGGFGQHKSIHPIIVISTYYQNTAADLDLGDLSCLYRRWNLQSKSLAEVPPKGPRPRDRRAMFVFSWEL